MYFKSFPYTYYSLDNTKTVQVVTNISTRVTLSDEVKSNLSLYDEYDIKDGETPELVADKFYKNPELHWLVLHYNDIIDPRFDWPLSTNNLKKYTEGKYNNIDAVHHYEDINGDNFNANLVITSSDQFFKFTIGDVLVNNTNTGVGQLISKTNNSNVRITVTSGGFISNDIVRLSSNAQANAQITSVTISSGIPVTNLVYEDTNNETKRRIKILKSNYVDAIVNDFKKKLGE
jgi:hypothetical protein